MKDYYKILGVDKKTSKGDIKKAYRTLSKKHHPDKGGDENKFKEINEAYSVLSDDKKRQQYDRPSSSRMFNGIQEAYKEIIKQKQRQSIKNRFNQKRVTLVVTLEELYYGCTKTIKYDRKIKCDSCDGVGYSKTKTCTNCDGIGHKTFVQTTPFGAQQFQEVCDVCEGNGFIGEEVCNSCLGKKYHTKTEEYSVNIPKGTFDGAKTLIEDMGDYITSDIYSDLVLVIELDKSGKYKLLNNNLHLNYEVDYIDILNEKEIEINCIDKTKVKIKLNKTINYSNELRIKGKGFVTQNNNVGDLYVKIVINFNMDKETEVKFLKEYLYE